MTSELQKEGKVVQRYSQQWVVELDDSDPDPISGPEIAAMAGIPRPGRSTYSPRPGLVVPFAICKSVTPKADSGTRRRWTVMATFERIGSEQQDPQNDSFDPANFAPKIEPFTTDIELPMFIDFDNKVICDPFEQLFDTPVMAKLALPGVRVTRYVDSFDENTLASWKHTTNETTWRGKPKDSWCVQNVTGQEVQIGNFTRGQLQFEISSNDLELKVDGVNTRVGWMDTRALLSSVYKDASGKLQDFRIDGTTTATLRWVDKNGNRSPIVDGRQTPQFLAFRNRKRKNFNLIVRS
ncbi:MAG: hypothetical protein ACO1RT_04760 [Planctomycetaceae bacterium]